MYDKFYDVVLPQPQIWKPVRHYEGLYIVSNYGEVRSLDRERTWYRKDIDRYCTRVFKGKLMSCKLKDNGYTEVHLRDEDRHNYWTTHKIVSEAFEEDLTLPVIDHKDDVKTHNFLWNLHRCTVQYNTKKYSNSESCGNERYQKRIPEDMKTLVRALLSEGVSMRKIERENDISQRSIARIRDGLI